MSNELELITLDPREVVVVEGRNSRLDLGDIGELAQSIQDNGMQEPAKVQRTVDGEYQLVNGHRRHAACMKLISKGVVPIFLATVLGPDVAEDEILASMVMANNGKPFTPIEEAMMLQKLKDTFKLTDKQIAERIGKSMSHVSNRLTLLRADDSIKEAMQDGTLKTTEALAIVKKSNGNKEVQKAIAKQAKAGDKSIINKELLNGRFNAEQKEVIMSAFLGLEQFGITALEVKEYSISDSDEIMKAFIAGCFMNCADLAFTDVEQFYDKIKQRVEATKAAAPVKR